MGGYQTPVRSVVSKLVDARFTAEITKIEPDQRRFWGWAYIMKRADGTQVTDVSGDTISTRAAREAFEDAFYRYVRDSGAGDDQHELFGVSKLIEAVAFTKDKARAMGIPDDVPIPEGFWVGFEVLETPQGDALWERVKKREGAMLSIVGRGFRA